jgi:hypothetical protein
VPAFDKWVRGVGQLIETLRLIACLGVWKQEHRKRMAAESFFRGAGGKDEIRVKENNLRYSLTSAAAILFA